MHPTAETTQLRPRAARSWRRAAGLAAAFVYVPQLLPLVATDLPDHGHCVGIYLRHFPVLVGLGPGLSARMATDLGEPGEEFVLLAVAALTTLTLLALAAVALRRWRRMGMGVALGVALVSAALSMGAVAIIRS